MKNNYNFNGKTILLAEDDESSALLAQVILKDTGAKVMLAKDGLEVLTLTANNAFDLILMDMKMPEMDGYKATTILRKLNLQLPIIAYTAMAMKEEREKCFEVGCTDYLAKPVSQEVMLSTIDKYLK